MKSPNVIDDCKRGGGDFSYSELHLSGGYSVDGPQGAEVTFLPNKDAPAFPGTLAGEFFVVWLPPALGLGPAQWRCERGRGSPFSLKNRCRIAVCRRR
jgi:hypothetical protein